MADGWKNNSKYTVKDKNKIGGKGVKGTETKKNNRIEKKDEDRGQRKRYRELQLVSIYKDPCTAKEYEKLETVRVIEIVDYVSKPLTPEVRNLFSKKEFYEHKCDDIRCEICCNTGKPVFMTRPLKVYEKVEVLTDDINLPKEQTSKPQPPPREETTSRSESNTTYVVPKETSSILSQVSGSVELGSLLLDSREPSQSADALLKWFSPLLKSGGNFEIPSSRTSPDKLSNSSVTSPKHRMSSRISQTRKSSGTTPKSSITSTKTNSKISSEVTTQPKSYKKLSESREASTTNRSIEIPSPLASKIPIRTSRTSEASHGSSFFRN